MYAPPERDPSNFANSAFAAASPAPTTEAGSAGFGTTAEDAGGGEAELGPRRVRRDGGDAERSRGCGEADLCGQLILSIDRSI